ncbi:metal-dependent phosphohydrolase [Megalodesulfovibrio paquesii]
MMHDSAASAGLTRRQLLALIPAGVVAGQLAGFAGLAGSVGAAQAAPAPAAPSPISYADCATLTPLQMAQASPAVQAGWNFCIQCCDRIQDAALRATVRELLDTPAPTFMAGRDAKVNEEIIKELTAKGLLAADIKPELVFPPLLTAEKDPAKAPQPFLSAPGSKYNGHHGYPGGLATHVAGNLSITLGMIDAYKNVYDMTVVQDRALAGQLLHDNMKPWVFQWQADGSCLPEGKIAGTGTHHVLGITEAWHRGLPAPVVASLASAHAAYSDKPTDAGPQDWIKAAGIILGKDPVAAGLLEADGTMLQPLAVENFLVHLGDGDWVFTGTAAAGARKALEAAAQARYGLAADALNTKEYNAFRNYASAVLTMERLYAVRCGQGQQAVETLVAGVVRSA